MKGRARREGPTSVDRNVVVCLDSPPSAMRYPRRAGTQRRTRGFRIESSRVEPASKQGDLPRSIGRSVCCLLFGPRAASPSALSPPKCPRRGQRAVGILNCPVFAACTSTFAPPPTKAQHGLGLLSLDNCHYYHVQGVELSQTEALFWLLHLSSFH